MANAEPLTALSPEEMAELLQKRKAEKAAAPPQYGSVDEFVGLPGVNRFDRDVDIAKTKHAGTMPNTVATPPRYAEGSMPISEFEKQQQDRSGATANLAGIGVTPQSFPGIEPQYPTSTQPHEPGDIQNFGEFTPAFADPNRVNVDTTSALTPDNTVPATAGQLAYAHAAKMGSTTSRIGGDVAEGAGTMLRNFQPGTLHVGIGLQHVGRFLKQWAKNPAFFEHVPLEEWDDVKRADTILGIASSSFKYGAHKFAESAPYFAGIMLAAPAIVVGEVNRLAEERAELDGRAGAPTVGDAAFVTAAALNNVYLEKYVLGRLLRGAGTGSTGKRIVRGGGEQSGAEAIQEFIEYYSKHTGTKSPPELSAALDASAAGAVAGVWAGTAFATGGALAKYRKEMIIESGSRIGYAIERENEFNDVVARQAAGEELSPEDQAILTRGPLNESERAMVDEYQALIQKAIRKIVTDPVTRNDDLGSDDMIVPAMIKFGMVHISPKDVARYAAQQGITIQQAITDTLNHEVPGHLYASAAESLRGYNENPEAVLEWIQSNEAYVNDFPYIDQEANIQEAFDNGEISEYDYHQLMVQATSDQVLAYEEYANALIEGSESLITIDKATRAAQKRRREAAGRAKDPMKMPTGDWRFGADPESKTNLEQVQAANAARAEANAQAEAEAQARSGGLQSKSRRAFMRNAGVAGAGLAVAPGAMLEPGVALPTEAAAATTPAWGGWAPGAVTGSQVVPGAQATAAEGAANLAGEFAGDQLVSRGESFDDFDVDDFSDIEEQEQRLKEYEENKANEERERVSQKWRELETVALQTLMEERRAEGNLIWHAMKSELDGREDKTEEVDPVDDKNVYMKVSDMNNTQVRYRDQNNFLAKVIRRELNESNIDPEERSEINELVKGVKTAFGAVYGKLPGVNEALEGAFTTEDGINDEYQRLMRLAQRNDEAGVEDSIVSDLDEIAARAKADRDVARRKDAEFRYEDKKGGARDYTFKKGVKHVDRGRVTPAVARKLLEARLEEGSIDQAQFDQKMEGVNTTESEARGRFPPSIREKLANIVWDERNTEKIPQEIIDLAAAESRVSTPDKKVPETPTGEAEAAAVKKGLKTKTKIDLDKVREQREAAKQSQLDKVEIQRLEPDYAAVQKQKQEYQKQEDKKRSIDASWLGEIDKAEQAEIDSMSALDYEEHVKEWGDESTMLDGHDVYMKQRKKDGVSLAAASGRLGASITDKDGETQKVGAIVKTKDGDIVQVVSVSPDGSFIVDGGDGIGTRVAGELETTTLTELPASKRRSFSKAFESFLKENGFDKPKYKTASGKFSPDKLAKHKDDWESALNGHNARNDSKVSPGNDTLRLIAKIESGDRGADKGAKLVAAALKEGYGTDYIIEHVRELMGSTGRVPEHHDKGNIAPVHPELSGPKTAYTGSLKYAESQAQLDARKNSPRPFEGMLVWLSNADTAKSRLFKKDFPQWAKLKEAVQIIRGPLPLEEKYVAVESLFKGETVENKGVLNDTRVANDVKLGIQGVLRDKKIFMKMKDAKRAEGKILATDADVEEATTQGNLFSNAMSHLFGRPTAAVAAFDRVSPFTLELGDVPSASVIANKVQVHHSSTMRPDELKEGKDYIQSVSIKTGELNTGLSRIFSTLTNNVGVINDKINSQIIDHLSGKDVTFTNPTIKKAAEDIKTLIEGVYQYSKDTTKDLDSPLDLRGNADSLVPRVWNIDYLATQAGRNKFLMAMRKHMGPLGSEKLTPNDLYSIVINSGGMVQGEWTNTKPSQVTSKADIENDERAQEYLDGVPASVLVDAGLVVTDLQAILPRFIEKAVRRSEYSKIFEKNDEILRGLLKSGVEEINAHNEKVLQLEVEGRPTKLLDAKKFEKSVWDLSKILRHQYGYDHVGVTTRKNVQRATNTATMLKGVFFTLASTPEFLTPLLKKGIRPDQFAVDFTLATVYATHKAMTGISKLLLNKHLPAAHKRSSELTGVLRDAALLREMGVMDIGAMGDISASRYTNQAFAPGGIKSGARNTLGAKVPKSVRAVFNMQTYMQAIMLTTMTEMQQIMAFKNFQRHMGKRIGYVKASKGPLKGMQLSNMKQYKQDMADYGLSADIDMDTADGQAAFQAGALRFVDQVITRPNDATTAKVFRNPMTAPIFLFKRFITTYSNTLLNSIVTDLATKVDNTQRAKQVGQLAVTAASMYGAVMFAEIMRGAIKGDLEDDDFKVNPEDFKTFMRRLDRTGLVSAPGAMALNFAAPYKSWGGERGSDRIVELGGVFASDMKATLDFYLSKKGEKDFNRLFGQIFPTSRVFMDKNKDKTKNKRKNKGPVGGFE